MRNYKREPCFAQIRAALIVALCLVMAKDAAAIGQAAVVTLSFPVGARPTAMGEAFTGLANDANAVFYNPAGLGQSPLTLSWKTHFGDSAFTAVAARSSAEFGSRDYVWAGSHAGVMRFNGKIWEKGEVYLVEGDESLRSVAQRYFVSDDKAIIDSALWELRRANKLGMKRYDNLVALLTPLADAFKGDTVPFNAKGYARMLILLTPDESVSSHIADKVLPHSMDEQARKALADKITDILGSEDRGISDVTELTIPYTVAVRDTVTAMAIDASERLWVGTVNGLWRYHNGKWQRYTVDNDLPSNRITAVSVSSSGEVAVGTEEGLALMKDMEWVTLTSENGLIDSYITSLAFTGNEQLYVGTPRGMVRKSGDSFSAFDTSAGLLTLGVTALFADSKGRLWIGGENGITIYSQSARTWARYKFPGSIVYSFAEQSNGTVWIGTNKGVITHKTGKTTVSQDGKPVAIPEWKTYHSKNALKNDNIRAIAACGKDLWVATDGAMHQYANADRQILLYYEQIMPQLQMTDLWHGFPAVVIPTEDWGTLAFSMNYINMGNNEQWDEDENFEGKSRAWEGVFGVSYGLPIKEDLSLGINAKYIYSVLDSRSGGEGQTFAIDVGVLKRNLFIDKFDLGFMLQNMGPKIYYITPEEADPIPFTLRLGLAYRPIQTPFHELTLLADAYREVAKNYYDKGPDPFWVALWTGMLANKDSSPKEEVQEINVSLGMEYLYADFMALRLGFLGDYLGERFELSLGLGVKYANMNFDFCYIHSPEGFMRGPLRLINKENGGASGVRDGQWRISFLFGL